MLYLKFYSHEASGEFYLTRYIEGNFNSSTKLVVNDDHLFLSYSDSILYYSNNGAWDLNFENVLVTNYSITGIIGFGPYFFIRTGNYYNLLKNQNGLVVPVEDSLFNYSSSYGIFFSYPYVALGGPIYKYVEGFGFYSVGQVSSSIQNNTGIVGDTLISYFYWTDGPNGWTEHSVLRKIILEEPSFPSNDLNWGFNVTQLHCPYCVGYMVARKNLYYMMWVNVITTKNSQLAYLPATSDNVALTDNYIFLLGDSVRYSKWYAGSTFYPFSWTDVTNVKNQSVHPSSFNLCQNYPNPFNPTTKIKYQIPGLSKVKLTVYDVLGREVKTLVNEEKSAGNYEVEFDGTNLTSGIYFYKIETEKFSDTKKFVLLK